VADDVLPVVDDERAILRALTAGLSANGYRVATAATGTEALQRATRESPAVIVLDLGLPDVDGLDVCRRVRAWSDVPIIVLTAEGSNERKVEALDLGADDYVTKPFDMSELLARVRVALRHRRLRPVGPEDAVLQVGDVVIDLARRTVTVGEHAVDLTKKEFSFLALLARYPGRVLTHRTILQEVWGPDYSSETHYLRVYASQIRKKIQAAGGDPNRIVTEPGIGYRLLDADRP
jgi:two-component system KDP operon response regulator KdpE